MRTPARARSPAPQKQGRSRRRLCQPQMRQRAVVMAGAVADAMAARGRTRPAAPARCRERLRRRRRRLAGCRAARASARRSGARRGTSAACHARRSPASPAPRPARPASHQRRGIDFAADRRVAGDDRAGRDRDRQAASAMAWPPRARLLSLHASRFASARCAARLLTAAGMRTCSVVSAVTLRNAVIRIPEHSDVRLPPYGYQPCGYDAIAASARSA